MNNTIKSIKLAALAIAIGFGTVSAQAGETQPYAGVSLGGFNIESKITGVVDSGSTTGYYVFLGADINDYLAAELRLGATGNAAVWGLNYKLSSFVSYLAKGQFPVSSDLRVYGLLGGTTANLKTSGGADVTKTGLTFGGGAEFNINEQLSVGAEWVRYWSNVTVSPSVDVSASGLSATLKYNF